MLRRRMQGLAAACMVRGPHGQARVGTTDKSHQAGLRRGCAAAAAAATACLAKILDIMLRRVGAVGPCMVRALHGHARAGAYSALLMREAGWGCGRGSNPACLAEGGDVSEAGGWLSCGMDSWTLHGQGRYVTLARAGASLLVVFVRVAQGFLGFKHQLVTQAALRAEK